MKQKDETRSVFCFIVHPSSFILKWVGGFATKVGVINDRSCARKGAYAPPIMKSETRRLLLGSAAGLGAALAARYALTAQQSSRPPVYRTDRDASRAVTPSKPSPRNPSKLRHD